MKVDIYMSANILSSSQGGPAAAGGTGGTDCPFYMMSTDSLRPRNPVSENENENPCFHECALFDCTLDEKDSVSTFQNNADEIIIE